MEIRNLAVALLAVLLCFTGKADESVRHLPKPPSPPRLVNNISASTNFLSPEESQALENKLESFARATSNQIVIVIVDTLYGYDMATFATAIGHEWKVGQEKKNNGVVILVYLGEPKRDIFIATGYGLEGVIPDATAQGIIDNNILPSFRKGAYYEGLNKGVDIIMDFAKGEYHDPKDYDKSGKMLGVIIAIAVVLIVLFISRRGGGRGGYTIGNSGIFFWGGGFGSGGGGFGGFGGGGGGGFGGFGGGNFGGGGAGGSW